MKRGCCYIIVLCCFLFAKLGLTFADKLKIAAGSLLEGDYFVALKLCSYITQANKGVGCQVVSTTGSLESLGLLKKREVDFAFTKSNLAVEAYEGIGAFGQLEPFRNIYQLLRLYNKVFTVMVRDDDHILTFKDLDGKRISNGPPSSDSSIVYNSFYRYYNFKKQPEDIEMPYEDYADALCKGKIDAVMYITNHPSALVNFMTNQCGLDFISIDYRYIEKMFNEGEGFHKSILQKDKYPGISRAHDSLGVSTIFVASGYVDKKIVKNFLDLFPKVVSSFKLSHPSLYNMSLDDFQHSFVLPNFEVDNNNK